MPRTEAVPAADPFREKFAAARRELSAAVLVIDARDRERLLDALPGLPAGDGDHRPITLGLDNRAVVRAAGGDRSRPVELALGRSRVTGQPVRVACNRDHPLRALRLGLGSISATSADKPVVCRTAAGRRCSCR